MIDSKYSKRIIMPTGVYDHQIRLKHRGGNQGFYETEIGKKWLGYEGVLHANRQFENERSAYLYKIKKQKKESETGLVIKPKGRKPRCLKGNEPFVPMCKEQIKKNQLAAAATIIKCSCGQMIRRGYKSVHIKTKKHLNQYSYWNIDDLPPPPAEWLEEDREWAF